MFTITYGSFYYKHLSATTWSTETTFDLAIATCTAAKVIEQPLKSLPYAGWMSCLTY